VCGASCSIGGRPPLGGVDTCERAISSGFGRGAEARARRRLALRTRRAASGGRASPRRAARHLIPHPAPSGRQRPIARRLRGVPASPRARPETSIAAAKSTGGGGRAGQRSVTSFVIQPQPGRPAAASWALQSPSARNCARACQAWAVGAKNASPRNWSTSDARIVRASSRSTRQSCAVCRLAKGWGRQVAQLHFATRHAGRHREGTRRASAHTSSGPALVGQR